MRAVRFIACGAVALIITSGCGGGGGSSSPTSPTPPAGGATGTVIGVVGDRGSQSFTPNPAQGNQGVMVSWRNNDGVTHRIVLNDGTFDTGDIAPGATSPIRPLPTNGANYHCTIHPGMIGAIAGTNGPPPCTGQYCE
jgi:plastocyanin